MLNSGQDLQAEKSKLRKQFKLSRERLSQEQRDLEATWIRDRVLRWVRDHQAKTIHCYVDYGSEVPTLNLIDRLLDAQITVVCPRMMSPRVLSHHRVERVEDLVRNRTGILEPDGSSPVFDLRKMELDLILIPGLGFSESGKRLGYGGGYYDTFLASVSGFKVGLAFSCQIQRELPMECHDVMLDEVWAHSGRAP